MRPARIIAAVTLVAAAAVAGSYFAVSTAHRSAAAPAAPVTAPPLQSTPTHPVDPAPPGPTSPGPIAIDRVPAPRPVLANGRYDSYIRTVDSGRGRLVVDLVQVFQGQAAVDAAITDGMARDKAQYLGVYVRNQNPRLTPLGIKTRDPAGQTFHSVQGEGDRPVEDVDRLVVRPMQVLLVPPAPLRRPLPGSSASPLRFGYTRPPGPWGGPGRFSLRPLGGWSAGRARW